MKGEKEYLRLLKKTIDDMTKSEYMIIKKSDWEDIVENLQEGLCTDCYEKYIGYTIDEEHK